ncbi:MAG: hypothetical protein J1F42_10845 [Lachnospiraceae bacterium]|nr:hypothetical protein [Lachnospiraceae bacterium]
MEKLTQMLSEMGMEKKKGKTYETFYYFQKCTEYNDYFWNALFAILLEPIRDIRNLTEIGGDIGASDTLLKYILSCKRKLVYEEFLRYCKYLGCNIDFMEDSLWRSAPLLNKICAYLENVGEKNYKKVSISKKYRQRFLAEADYFSGDNYLLEQELAQNESEQEKILEIFSDLSKKELSLLYQVADGFPYTNEYDDLLMEHYPQLNTVGQSYFLELLEVVESEHGTSNGDKFCDFCRKMSEETEIEQSDISPLLLYKKLIDINFCTIDCAEILKKYRYVDKNFWSVLEKYHRVMLACSDKPLQDLSFSEKDCLVIMLRGLSIIPSLGIYKIKKN